MNTENQIQILIEELYRLQDTYENLSNPLQSSFDNYNHIIKALADTHPEMLGNSLPLNDTALKNIEEAFTNLQNVVLSLNKQSTTVKDRILEVKITDMAMRLRPPYILEKATSYNTKELCTIFDISLATLQRHIKEGLPKTSKVNTNIQFDAKKVTAWFMKTKGKRPDFAYEV